MPIADTALFSRLGHGRPERWLVLGHEATNSGAPRMLLRVLEEVRRARGANWDCEIVLRNGGPLLAEFASFGPVRVLGHPAAETRTLTAGVLRKVLVRPWLQPRRFQRGLPEWQQKKFDLVYNNTATNGEFLRGASQLGCPIVTQVHELGSCIRRFNTPAAIADTIALSDRFIAVSNPVAQDLVGLGAGEERVTVVPNFLSSLPESADAATRAAARRRLQLREGAKVVVGCGHLDMVKGPDLFLDVAEQVLRAGGADTQFYWLGGVSDVRLAKRLGREVKRRGLAEVIRFVGYVADPQPWYAASDAVAVTSRSESFSLVALEAAAVGRPVVGFAGARGLGSVLGDTAELLAPGHDPRAMAALLQMLLLNPERAHALGQRLRARVAAEFLATPCVEKILSVVEIVRQLPRRA
jgi:glycosyltransferase involved in cell wall biosynthesis